ncbi:MAG TPA: peptidoglycan DD-metalloendopeptidase family protein [Vicinamibacteria bacterium]|nr:peptidoglycan DD-metalloendopeptidase family protein [Vicinamibacteria bacterium]
MRLPAALLALTAVAASAASRPGTAPSPAPPASPAASTDERLRQIQERRRALAADLERMRGDARTLLGEVERLEVEVRLRGEELREAQVVLQRTNQQLEATVERLRGLEDSLARARPVLAARARALYKLGELSYLRLLLSVDRPSDFFSGYRFVNTLARRDNERLSRFRADMRALEQTRAELERKTAEAFTLRAGHERARRNLEADRVRKTKLLTDLVASKETGAAYLQELEEAESRLSELLAGTAAGDVSVPMGAFKGELPWPVAGRVRSVFGKHKHPRFDTYTVQNGIDIEAPVEAPVHAVHEGGVVFADRFRGYGLLVILEHGRHHTLYAHLAESAVRTGQRVVAGAVVGTVGSSGLEGEGLYFELRTQGKPEDPLAWLRKR